MRVEKINVHNILGVSELEIPAGGKNLILIGGHNGQGKTSAIQALTMAICGKRGMDYPEIPIRDGESHGSVEVTLSDLDPNDWPDTKELVVKRIIERGRSGSISDRIEITDEAGDPAPEPQALLNKLYQTRGLNPIEFDGMKKAAQRENLLKAVGLHAELERIDSESEAVFDERRSLGTKGTAEKNSADAIKISVPGVTHETPKVETEELDALMGQATNNSKQLSDLRQSLSEIRKDYLAAGVAVQTKQDELKRLRELVSNAETDLAEAISKEASHKIELDSADDAVSQFKVIDATEIAKQLRAANDTNLAVEQAIRRQKHLDEAERLRVEYAKCTSKLKQLEAEKTRLLETAQWPVDGMTVDAEGVLIDSIPIEQCSTAQRIITWVKVACALNPTLKLIVIRNGNDLDNESLALLDEFLRGTDYQALVEFVTRTADDESRCAVVLENGKAKELPEV